MADCGHQETTIVTLDVEAELTRLGEKSVPDLLVVYRQVFGCPATSRHRLHLIRRIVWGLQANGAHTPSSRTLRRVAELVDPYDLRVSSITDRPGRCQKAGRPPIPGTVICRPYKGDLLEVQVLKDGFRFRGQEFGSLTAIAKHVTGSHWNGNLFFGIASVPKKERPSSGTTHG